MGPRGKLGHPHHSKYGEGYGKNNDASFYSIARGHHGMRCKRAAAQKQAVSHITVILTFSIKYVTYLSSPTYVLTIEACACNSAL